MIDKDKMVRLLKQWGYWQRTAKTPKLSYAVSQFDTPLEKKRNVIPIFQDEKAEQLDKLIMQHFSDSERYILELTYVERESNIIIAEYLHCSVKTIINTRNEIIAGLRGLGTYFF